MKKFFLIGLSLLIFVLTASCTRNNAQRDFEQDAYSAPAGYTETTAQAEIISLDEDDWRTSPLYQGLVNIVPAYPNPVATNQQFYLEIESLFNNSINGFEVIVRLPNNDLYTLYQEFDTPLPSLKTILLDPLELGIDGSPEAARGLKRIYIFDLDGQMISYGDIMVE
ncbi:hypothetical protein ACKGJO_02815 [Gracilimonas sp. Q87]|uniref:hypothetical protein n=1 Tax=Gracilimonas sp. Q87 TaxID=3384766 RepID=UPI003983F3DB